jgi:hypothetical protein
VSSVFDGICGFNSFSGNDFPGAVSAVLFYSGCNLRCPYCQNPNIVSGKVEPIDYGELEFFLKKRKINDKTPGFPAMKRMGVSLLCFPSAKRSGLFPKRKNSCLPLTAILTL